MEVHGERVADPEAANHGIQLSIGRTNRDRDGVRLVQIRACVDEETGGKIDWVSAGIGRTHHWARVSWGVGIETGGIGRTWRRRTVAATPLDHRAAELPDPSVLVRDDQLPVLRDAAVSVDEPCVLVGVVVPERHAGPWGLVVDIGIYQSG